MAVVPEASLAEGLLAVATSMSRSTGSLEYRQVASLLDEAVRYRLDPAAVAGVDAIVETSAWTIEHNLDAIAHPASAPLWVEFEDAPRRREGLAFEARDTRRVGYLVAPSPADPDAATVVVAWELASGTVHHAYGLVHWHRGDLVVHAANARHRYSRVSLEARARMMALFSVATPQSFKRMIEHMHEGGDPRLVDASLMDGRLASSGEMVFAFGVLALLVSSAPRSIDEDGFETVGFAGEALGLLGRLRNGFSKVPTPSFDRRRRRGVVSVGITA